MHLYSIWIYLISILYSARTFDSNSNVFFMRFKTDFTKIRNLHSASFAGNHFSNLLIENRIIGKFLIIRPFLFFFSRTDKFCIVPIKPLHLSLLRFLTIILWKFNDLERLMPYILFIIVWSSVLVHPASTGLAWPHFWSTVIHTN